MSLHFLSIVLGCCFVGPTQPSPKLLDMHFKIVRMECLPNIRKYRLNSKAKDNIHLYARVIVVTQYCQLLLTCLGRVSSILMSVRLNLSQGPISFGPIGCSVQLLHLCQIIQLLDQFAFSFYPDLSEFYLPTHNGPRSDPKMFGQQLLLFEI